MEPSIETSGRSRATCVRGPKRLPDSPPSTTRRGVASIHDARAVTHRNDMIPENTRFSFHCYSDPCYKPSRAAAAAIDEVLAVEELVFPFDGADVLPLREVHGGLRRRRLRHPR